MRKLLWILLLLGTSTALAQVKVGDNINTIDAASILELESNSKAFVPTRVSTVQMNAITPLNGAMVYNTDSKCIYIFDGIMWRSLCNSQITFTTSSTAPSDSMVGDIWVNETDGKVSVWNGTDWLILDKNPKSGDGLPSPATVTTALAGDTYVNRFDGSIYTYDGTDWINNSAVSAENGISKNASNAIELGGALTKPTVILSDNTNTLALEGLELIDDATHTVITAEPTTGILKRTSISSLVQKEEVVVVANAGQNQFNTPLTITNPQKIDVYRNGVKIDFSPIGSNLIELETNVICFQNDEIRIVQFF